MSSLGFNLKYFFSFRPTIFLNSLCNFLVLFKFDSYFFLYLISLKIFFSFEMVRNETSLVSSSFFCAFTVYRNIILFFVTPFPYNFVWYLNDILVCYLILCEICLPEHSKRGMEPCLC